MFNLTDSRGKRRVILRARGLSLYRAWRLRKQLRRWMKQQTTVQQPLISNNWNPTEEELRESYEYAMAHPEILW